MMITISKQTSIAQNHKP